MSSNQLDFKLERERASLEEIMSRVNAGRGGKFIGLAYMERGHEEETFESFDAMKAWYQARAGKRGDSSVVCYKRAARMTDPLLK